MRHKFPQSGRDDCRKVAVVHYLLLISYTNFRFFRVLKFKSDSGSRMSKAKNLAILGIAFSAICRCMGAVSGVILCVVNFGRAVGRKK